MSASLKLAQEYLGKEVEVIVDRPLGSKHPKHGFIYQTNYGYIPGTKSPDGEELDAYYLGGDNPLKKAKGFALAIIHRTQDDDDKLVVVSEEKNDISDEEIEKAVEFQEKWFEHVIVREDPYHVLKYKDKLPYRKAVVGVVTNSENKYLITQNHGSEPHRWRYAGGGIEENEAWEEAILRELREELGTDKFEVIQTSSFSLQYDWPDDMIVNNADWERRLYKGQEQKQVLVKYTGSIDEIIFDTNELQDIKWVDLADLKIILIILINGNLQRKCYKNLV